MNKICTSLEQSQKLVELGIDIETADMCYINEKPNIGFLSNEYEMFGDNILSDYYPAWSLTALLSLMPKLYEFENDPNDDGCQPNLCKGWDNNLWHIVYRSTIYTTKWYNDPVDAAFEMVVWLKENGKL